MGYNYIYFCRKNAMIACNSGCFSKQQNIYNRGKDSIRNAVCQSRLLLDARYIGSNQYSCKNETNCKDIVTEITTDSNNSITPVTLNQLFQDG